MMDKKLVNGFKPEYVQAWSDVEEADQVGFDSFYDELSRWAVDQRELTYEDFAAAEL